MTQDHCFIIVTVTKDLFIGNQVRYHGQAARPIDQPYRERDTDSGYFRRQGRVIVFGGSFSPITA